MMAHIFEKVIGCRSETGGTDCVAKEVYSSLHEMILADVDGQVIFPESEEYLT